MKPLSGKAPFIVSTAFLLTALTAWSGVFGQEAPAEQKRGRVEEKALTTPERVKKLEERLAEVEAARDKVETDLQKTNRELTTRLEKLVNDKNQETQSDVMRRVIQLTDKQQTDLEAVNTKQKADSQAVTAAMQDMMSRLVPVGTVVSFGGDRAKVPAGWLVCDGKEYPKPDYPLLAETLAGNWKVADGASFRVPDLRGKFLRGLDESGVTDPEGTSRQIGSSQSDMIAQHQHGITNNQHGGQAKWGDGIIFPTGVAGRHNTITTYGNWPATTMDAGGAETRPKNTAVYYIIRAR